MGKDLNKGKIPNYNNKIGKVFGNLKCINFNEYRKMPNGRIRPYFEFECLLCGKHKILRWDTVASKNSNIKSCGCDKGRHGLMNTRLYTIWHSMKSRCDYPSSHQYNNYGGRGISYCDDWKIFINFYNWAINNGYSDNLELDRIDSNKNYYPDNCRWISHKQNMRNRRNSIKIKYNGKIQTLKEWCEELNFPYSTIYNRYNKGIKDPKELFKPIDIKMSNIRHCKK